MSKTRNTHQRSSELQATAQTLIDIVEHDAASAPVAKALRITAQHRLMELTGCTATTARNHIYKAIRRLRHVD